MTEKEDYNNIFKSTFLFSFVRVLQILLGIIRNKVVAILLGAEGVGIIGILSNSISLLQTGSGLGISQSAVRDISEANGAGDRSKFSRILSLTNRVILISCLLGCLVTVALSPLLSEWTFGDKSYTIAYFWLAIVVALNILTEGQLALLKGMRQLRTLAKASVIGSIIGLITAVPLYYFFKKSGIVPSLIIASASSVFFSYYFARKIKYEKTKLSLEVVFKQAAPMIKMGVALMLVSFLGLLFDLVIASYIRSRGGLEIVGYYRAGTTIIASYFGIVITAMTTDYYPRISAIHSNNEKLQEEVNKQSEVGLVLIFPIAILFVFLSPIVIKLLYSKQFIATIAYTDYAILGTVLIVCSDSMGMILLAKQSAKIFTLFSFAQRLLFVPVYIFFYNHYGLMGLGISYMLNVLTQFILLAFINRYKFNISFKRRVYKQLVVVLTTILIMVFIRRIDARSIKYLLGFGTLLFSSLYSFKYMKEVMNINLFEYFNKRGNDTYM